MLAKNLALLAVFLLVAGALYWTDFHRVDEKAEEARLAKLVTTLKQADVTGLTLSVRDEGASAPRTLAVTRVATDLWTMTAPVADRAGTSEITRILGDVANLERTAVVDENPKDPAEFGLAEPRAVLTLTKTGAATPFVLELGRRNPVGYSSYVRTNESPAVFMVSASIESSLTKKVSDIRNRKPFDGADRTDVRSMTLSWRAGERLVLARRGDAWVLSEPAGDLPLDQSVVNGLFDAFRDLRVDWFIAEKADDAALYGLDAPELVVAVDYADDARKDAELAFGKAADGNDPEDASRKLEGYYARTNYRDTVYVVASFQRDKLAKHLDDLRDKTLMPAAAPSDVASLELTWGAGAPVRFARADEAWTMEGTSSFPVDGSSLDHLVDALGNLKAEAFEADAAMGQPALSVGVTWATTAHPPVTLSFAWTPDNVFCRTSLRPTVTKVRASLRQALPDSLLALRSKDLARGLTTKDLAGVDVTAAGLDRIALEASDEGWRVAGPDGGTLRAGQPAAWIERVGGLRAERFVAQGLGDLAQYGLVDPVAHVTLRRRGAAPPLWFKVGSATADGRSFHAACSDVDAIFTLTSADAKVLLSPPLLATPAGTASRSGSAASPAADGDATLPRVTITTDKGSFTAVLFEDEAPNTVANFVKLGTTGFFDGTTFHRVEGFCIQGGDPNSKDDDPDNDGKGGPGYTIADETSPKRRHARGVLSMAHAGPGTGGSQFFVTKTEASWLDGVHTVFGAVTEGMDVVDAVTKGTRITGVSFENLRDHPYEPVTRPR